MAASLRGTCGPVLKSTTRTASSVTSSRSTVPATTSHRARWRRSAPRRARRREQGGVLGRLDDGERACRPGSCAAPHRRPRPTAEARRRRPAGDHPEAWRAAARTRCGAGVPRSAAAAHARDWAAADCRCRRRPAKGRGAAAALPPPGPARSPRRDRACWGLLPREPRLPDGARRPRRSEARHWHRARPRAAAIARSRRCASCPSDLLRDGFRPATISRSPARVSAT